jgi:hypothetical protein
VCSTFVHSIRRADIFPFWCSNWSVRWRLAALEGGVVSLLRDAGLIGVEDWAVAGELNRLRLGFRHQASSLGCSIHPRYKKPKP